MDSSSKIDRVFSPTETKNLVNDLALCLEQYYRECQAMTSRTVPPLTPEVYMELVREKLTDNRTSFKELANLALSQGHHLHDPRYMGHQVPPAIPAAALFDVLGRASSQGAAVFEMAPFGTAVEKVMINELGKMIGWKEGGFAGIGTHGGTLANVTALLAARNIYYKDSWKKGMRDFLEAKPALMTSADSHYCIARACGILGIGTSQVIKVPVDSKRRMDLKKSREILQASKSNGLNIFAIVGSACTTPTGSFDDLKGIASLAREFKLWFHVDGAHGASFLFSEKYKHLLEGIEEADSVAWDAHKMLFVPALSTYLLYKDARNSWEAFAQEAPYLFDPNDPQGLAEFDGGLRTMECTKGVLSLALWGVWSLYGKEFLASLIEKAMENTKTLYRLITNSKDFEVAHEPQCNILCFRFIPTGIEHSEESLSQLQQNIRNQLLKDGEGYITGTRIEGRYWLRVTIINPLTNETHLSRLLDKIRGI